jgi:hypothetical protein
LTIESVIFILVKLNYALKCLLYKCTLHRYICCINILEVFAQVVLNFVHLYILYK